jgi:DMSO/TMAO reductase YedYZ molybdopterin-dependent catalytic subunit
MTADTPTVESSRPERPGRAGLAGVAAVGLAFGLTELAAGLFDRVPSAVSAVGGLVVDWSPGFVKRFAIDLFGTADKGALAIGTVIIGLLIGYVVGRLAVRRRWAAAAAFSVFGVIGVAAGLGEPLVSAPGTIVAIASSAVAGWAVLRWAIALMDAADPGSPTDGLPADPGRRRFAAVVAGAGAAGLIGGVAGRKSIIDRSERIRVATGLPAPESVVAEPAAGNFFTVEGLEEIVVPNDRFYRIDTALVVPRPRVDSWRLKVTGLVEREMEYSLDDILAMDLHERYVTISCVSNEVGGSLVGNAKWTGVRLVELLDRSGVLAEGTQIVGRSVDGWTAGFPTELAFDGRDPLLAVGMNGVPLPARHGYPARLIVPGLYGYVSATKWIEEIEITRWEDFDAYWVPRGWSKTGPIKTQSRIDTPRSGAEVPGDPAVLAGVAWAPLKGIARVEVRIDNGPWHEAEVTTPLSDASWVQWKVELPVAAGNHYAEVRATDGEGATQTEARSRPDPDGATGWHGVSFEVA